MKDKIIRKLAIAFLIGGSIVTLLDGLRLLRLDNEAEDAELAALSLESKGVEVDEKQSTLD